MKEDNLLVLPFGRASWLFHKLKYIPVKWRTGSQRFLVREISRYGKLQREGKIFRLPDVFVMVRDFDVDRYK